MIYIGLKARPVYSVLLGPYSNSLYYRGEGYVVKGQSGVVCRERKKTNEIQEETNEIYNQQHRCLELAVKALAYATGNKLELQLAPYLYGSLSKPSEEMKKKASSAPVHNMHAERTLGTVDALKKRSPNADISFLSAKTRCSQNKTLEWLLSKPEDEQKRLIAYCLKSGKDARMKMKEREKRCVEVMFGRIREKVHKKDVTKMNVLGSDIREKLKSGGVIDHPALDQLPQDQLTKLATLLAMVDQPIDPTYVDHMWWDKNVKDDVVYRGRVRSVKRKKNDDIYIKISYWLLSEGEQSAVDSNFLFSSFITDLLQSNLRIL